MSAEELYSIKMRASKKENGTDVHISGAEKIVEAPDVPPYICPSIRCL